MKKQPKLKSRTYKVKNIREYGLLTDLLKENNLPLISVKSQIITNEKGIEDSVVAVTTQGEQSFLDFVNYIFQRDTTKTDELVELIRRCL